LEKSRCGFVVRGKNNNISTFKKLYPILCIQPVSRDEGFLWNGVFSSSILVSFVGCVTRIVLQKLLELLAAQISMTVFDFPLTLATPSQSRPSPSDQSRIPNSSENSIAALKKTSGHLLWLKYDLIFRKWNLLPIKPSEPMPIGG
jgi:hypothetical protein